MERLLRVLTCASCLRCVACLSFTHSGARQRRQLHEWLVQLQDRALLVSCCSAAAYTRRCSGLVGCVSGWRRTYVLAFRHNDTISIERKAGFTHSHNDTVNVRQSTARAARSSTATGRTNSRSGTDTTRLSFPLFLSLCTLSSLDYALRSGMFFTVGSARTKVIHGPNATPTQHSTVKGRQGPLEVALQACMSVGWGQPAPAVGGVVCWIREMWHRWLCMRVIFSVIRSVRCLNERCS